MKQNTLPPKEEIGGVRRRGRSGRGSIQSKACLPVMEEEIENVESAKPLKSGKPVSDKTESRVGRPPSKKVSDRKGCTRTGENITRGSSDLDVDPEDDRKELLAAVNAARAARSVASSRAFWNQMESIFACVTSEDLAYLKHQITFAEELDGSLCDLLDTDQSEMGEITCQTMLSSEICQQASQENAVGLNQSVETPSSANDLHVLKMTSGELARERCFVKIIPLSQRLLSAIITEDESKMFVSGIKQGDAVLQFTSDSSPSGENSHAQNKLNPGFDVDHDLKSQTNCFGENIPCNGCATPNSFTSPNTCISCDETLQENDVIIHPDAGYVLHAGQSKTTWEESMAIDSYGTPYDCQFEHMPLDDRILMELHSIGIFPDTSPDLSEGDAEEIEKVISELNIKLYQEARNKKNQLIKLEKAIREGIEHERRNLEQLAMDKLVEMAYKRLLGRRGVQVVRAVVARFQNSLHWLLLREHLLDVGHLRKQVRAASVSLSCRILSSLNLRAAVIQNTWTVLNLAVLQKCVSDYEIVCSLLGFQLLVLWPLVCHLKGSRACAWS
ncbi:uncharacterized protein M6B38_260375 [Iris pallida]|uniref:Uncharacterized protein n=1 Tax=Iris pallida TaxID=29817 RepID=A0AAX6IFY7_IRIPA|nr:uncharacterized protein M6B38_260375 [Iris pallida]